MFTLQLDLTNDEARAYHDALARQRKQFQKDAAADKQMQADEVIAYNVAGKIMPAIAAHLVTVAKPVPKTRGGF